MAIKVYKVSTKYQRSSKKEKYMETGRGSSVNREGLKPYFYIWTLASPPALFDSRFQLNPVHQHFNWRHSKSIMAV